MNFADDRLMRAKQIPMREVADRLGLSLTRITAQEWAGPCPGCGDGGKGKRADRFAINTARGVFNCRKCGAAGDQVALVSLALGVAFKPALAHLMGEREAIPDPAAQEQRRRQAAAQEKRRAEVEAQMRARAIRDAREIWTAAEGQDLRPAQDYLAGRGIRFAAWPPTLRCLAAAPYTRKIGGSLKTFHTGPCLVAAVQDGAGRIRAVHRTWIDPARPGSKAQIFDDQGQALPAKLVRGSKKGGAIRLTPAPPRGGVLIMGEGIETTASALVLGAVPGAAYWAGVDLGNMSGRMIKTPGARYSGQPDLEDLEAFVPPRDLSRLIFLMDGDSDPAATRARLLSGLRRACAQTPGLRAEIVAAPGGRDFNDILTGEANHE